MKLQKEVDTTAPWKTEIITKLQVTKYHKLSGWTWLELVPNDSTWY